MDTKALRQKILDLAIRGKLVPQDPTDEPASVLLERIREQKQQMVKEGKLKAKDIKNDTVIFKGEDNLHYEKFADGSTKCIEDEIPFELPDGWAWCRVRDIASVKGGKRLPKGASFSDDITNHAYIRVTDMKNRSINTFGLKYISEDVFSKIQSYTIEKNDLYVTIAGTIGVVGEVPDILDGMNLTENAVKVCNISIDKTFLCYVMLSELVQQQFQDKTHQVAMPKLALERILGTLIPVSPIKEQQVIVLAIKNAVRIADTIESQKDALSDFVAITKSKILDLAIRGKLVPQDPNDEPASVLLKRIRAEKEELIKQGKIKRDKKESVIFKDEDNSYYGIDIPECWEVVSLASITKSISDGSHNPPPDSFCGIPILSAANIFNDAVQINSASRWVSEDDWVAENKRTNIEMGDVLLTIVGSIGRAAVVNTDTRFALQRSVAAIKPMLICSEYLMYFFESPIITNFFAQNSKGTAQKGIYLNSLRELKIFIPPLAEQKRIVAAIEIYYSKLDKIAEMLA